MFVIVTGYTTDSDQFQATGFQGLHADTLEDAQEETKDLLVSYGAEIYERDEQGTMTFICRYEIETLVENLRNGTVSTGEDHDTDVHRVSEGDNT